MAADSELTSGTNPASQDSAAVMRSRIETIAGGIRELEAAALAEAIAYTRAGYHRTQDGYSGLRDWVTSCFDFNYALAGQIARIARLGAKFTVLTEAALAGRARVDAVAYAIAKLEVTGLRIWARAPYAAPVPSPYDPGVFCRTPEELIAEHCCHASFAELKDAVAAMLAEMQSQREAILDELSQQTLQRLDLWRQEDGMWGLDATLTADTGRLLEGYLKTAVRPPRQDEADADRVLPSSANRNAEALHQLLARAGTDPQAPTRHGHTATLTLMADVEALQGRATGRLPRLEGEPVSIARARFLACEAGVVPMVYDYATGEVIEQSKELRVPNAALRRKLEAEQTEGCAWHGCGRPVSWCESHHIEHWIDGGKTTPENLILLCRFHHGRIHTGDWSVTKTGPGQAVIEHRADGIRDTDWDLADEETPTGLFPAEWSRRYKEQLSNFSGWYAMEHAAAAIRIARERFRAGPAASAAHAAPGAKAGSRTPEAVEAAPEAAEAHVDCRAAQRNQAMKDHTGGESGRGAAPIAPPMVLGERDSAFEPIPFLPGPSG